MDESFVQSKIKSSIYLWLILLVPYFFGVLGGIIGFLLTRKQNKNISQASILFGVLTTIAAMFMGNNMILSLVVPGFLVLLR